MPASGPRTSLAACLSSLAPTSANLLPYLIKASTVAAAAAAGQPDHRLPPHHGAAQHPLQHAATARAAWKRGSQRQRLPPGALSLIAERHRSTSSSGGGSSSGGSAPVADDSSPSSSGAAGSGASQHPLLGSPVYQAALQASLSRTTFSADQLLEAAAAQSASPGRRQLDGYSDMQPLLAAAMAALAGPNLDEMLERWTAASAERPPGFDSQAALAVPGLAGYAAVVSRGGRMSNRWKAENQDAFLLDVLGSPAGTAGAAGTAGTAETAGVADIPAAQQQRRLLVGVLDGHGVGGQAASQVAADGIAAELANRLGSGDASSSSDGGSSGSGSSGESAPTAQQALVEAFQRVAVRMQADAAFEEGGAAAVVCLVEPGSITCAWAGDCRAVAGLSLEGPGGPTFVVHPLTQDHKPDSPLELARVVASPLGRVVQFSPGAPPRLCGVGNPNTLALSRAFGDNWALPMGLTAEPDAITVALPPPAPGALGPAAGSSPAGNAGIDSMSTDTEEEGADGANGMSGGITSSDSCGGSGSSGGGSVGRSSSSSGSSGGAQVAPTRHVLLVACDGLWDYVTNQEAVDIALRHDSAEAAAHALADTARRRWAAAHSGEFVDDVTVAVCFIR